MTWKERWKNKHHSVERLGQGLLVNEGNERKCFNSVTDAS